MSMLRGGGLVGVFGVVLAVAGCPGPDTTIESGSDVDGSCDACARDGGGLDSGARDAAVDTGTAGADTGTGGADSGTGGVDSGTGGIDAGGGGFDSGTGGADSGTGGPPDAGTDAGTGGADSGGGAVDGGDSVLVDAYIEPMVDASLDRVVNGCSSRTATDLTGQPTAAITTSGFSYSPPCIRVRAGTVVTISAVPSFASHPLRAGTVVGGVATPDPTSPIPSRDTGTSVSFTPAVPGAYGYYCNFHFGFGMVGAIFVE